MKLLTIFGAAALVHAQADSTGYFPGEPSCALPCLSSAITAAGCQLSDIGCQCGPTQSVIANNVAGCIITSCTNPTDLGAAVNAGEAVCSSFFAGQLSFTQPSSGAAQTPTPVPGSSGSASDTSIIMTNPPTPTPTGSGSESSSSENSSEFSSETGSGTMTMTTGGTHTDTLIGHSTPHLTGSITGATSLVPSSPTSSPAGAAANTARLGAGILAGIVGAVAFL